jgi:hypothetical protein
MKTPIQEHIEWLKEKYKTLIDYQGRGVALEIGDCIEHAESMLEKEEVMIKYSYWEGIIKRAPDDFQVNDWYNKNFNTEKK